MDIFNSTLKTEAANAMKDVFDTFKRSTQVRFYKTQQEEVIIFDPDYNADFQEMNRHNESVQYTTEYQDFDARIWYLENQDGASFIGGGQELNVKTRQFYSRVKIQLEQDGYDYIKDANRITMFGEKFQIEDDIRRVGMLGDFSYYNVTLSRIL